jgi:Na+/H+ antiporter NhaA
MRLTKLFNDFFESEKGGVLLIVCTVISLLLANSSLGESYLNLWHFKFAGLSTENWINEGLMAIFFFLIGLELKREIFVGELSNAKNAMLPVFAAVGGMIIPAAIFAFFNYGTATQSGAGISSGNPCSCLFKNLTYSNRCNRRFGSNSGNRRVLYNVFIVVEFINRFSDFRNPSFIQLFEN